jgi:DNA-binding GntR family transcriptional regulator
VRKRYQVVATDIARRIATGDIVEKLPTCRQMMIEYRLCWSTMQKATEMLRAQGWIWTKPGVGHYVKKRSE